MHEKYSDMSIEVDRCMTVETTLKETFQDKIYDLINMQLDDMPSWNISNYSVDGTGSSEYTYSYRFTIILMFKLGNDLE